MAPGRDDDRIRAQRDAVERELAHRRDDAERDLVEATEREQRRERETVEEAMEDHDRRT
jgi:hypothetical protein